MPNALHIWYRGEGRVLLSQALDYQNRVFQLAHVVALLEVGDRLEALAASVRGERARCWVCGRAMLPASAKMTRSGYIQPLAKCHVVLIAILRDGHALD